ncbi:hypothetical protein CB0940_10460 [Cercospora beticola]|uniref:Uncharacterized protein n=1 Tax=Cercospora beticola TaxID=122368 RepID=A0A2G5HV04_CERBT|nr:hypothetical protein CB0940_10460 [Cercospora beticola]PIA96370.1 hypothetical protein CB0940_10460 [Cercospora beticola]WPB07178.1 hypothetical protein RHO25_011838 [Cercospora beticola]CAK1367137.1 unnamed protein product [Cercospora beticola]
MATQVQTTTKTQLNGAPRKPAAPRAAPVKKSTTATAAKRAPPSSAHKPAAHTQNKAASVAGENPASGGGVTSAYAIMASRIANRVAEMAESITFVERPKPSEADPEPVEQEKRRPRKLEMRLNNSAADSVAFSAPFLDNTLQKMLQLQNRMLKTTADLSKSEGVDEKMVKEHAAQSAELSRIIALICAEKARQGA